MHMNEGDIKARVIFVSSGSATGNTYGWAPYNASKAAVNSLCRCVLHQSGLLMLRLNALSRTLAQEEPDIVAIAVRPGRVDTAVRLDLFIFINHSWSPSFLRCKPRSVN